MRVRRRLIRRWDALTQRERDALLIVGAVLLYLLVCSAMWVRV